MGNRQDNTKVNINKVNNYMDEFKARSLNNKNLLERNRTYLNQGKNDTYTNYQKKQLKQNQEQDQALLDNQYLWQIDPTRRTANTTQEARSQFNIQKSLVDATANTMAGELLGAGLVKGVNKLYNIGKTLNKGTREINTINRVFEGGSPLPSTNSNAFIANDLNKGYRLTGQDQIDDIIKSGFVRAKNGKIKGGRINETHWSKGHETLKYVPQDGKYIISPKFNISGKFNGAIKGSDINIWKGVNGTWQSYNLPTKNIIKSTQLPQIANLINKMNNENK